MGKVLKILASGLPLAGILCSGCNTSGCTDNKSSIPLAGFYSYNTLSAISLSRLSVGGVGAPNDSLLLSNGSAQQLYLPFRPSQDVTSFYFHYHEFEAEDDPLNELNDTITFRYNRIPYFASEECGAMFHYNVTEFTYTTNLIDSVALVDSVITNIDTETIQIYFRTATE